MTAPHPEPLAEGWYEFITHPQALTCIAYVRESGEVYLPDATRDQWDTAREVRPLFTERAPITREQIEDILRDYDAHQEAGLVHRLAALVNGDPR